MKKSIIKKVVAVVLALVFALSLTACGGGGGATIKGKQTTLGKISVIVPEGYKGTMGNITGANDKDDTQCYIQPEKANMYDYYWIVIKKDEADAKQNVDMTKSSNEKYKPGDVTVKASNGEWKGCSYKYETATQGTIDCGSVYAVVDGTTYMVNFCGHAPSSAELTGVLGSIKAAK